MYRIPNIKKLMHLDLPLIHFARVVPTRYWARIRYYILFDILKNLLTETSSWLFIKISLKIIPDKLNIKLKI